MPPHSRVSMMSPRKASSDTRRAGAGAARDGGGSALLMRRHLSSRKLPPSGNPTAPAGDLAAIRLKATPALRFSAAAFQAGVCRPAVPRPVHAFDLLTQPPDLLRQFSDIGVFFLQIRLHEE